MAEIYSKNQEWIVIIEWRFDLKKKKYQFGDLCAVFLVFVHNECFILADISLAKVIIQNLFAFHFAT